MTLQTSGSIALSQIAGTFGGSSPYHLSSYYAGGSYVPNYSSGSSGYIPSSGTIKISEFYGASPYVAPTASVSPNGVSGSASGSTGSEGTVTTAAITCTVSGGVAPYTYAWAHVSGQAFTTNSQGSSTTTFSLYMGAGTDTGLYECQVTDSNGVSCYSAQFDVSASYSTTGECCWDEAFLVSGKRIGDAQVGDELLRLADDGEGHYSYEVKAIRGSTQPCGTIVTESGIELTCSYTTPIVFRRPGSNSGHFETQNLSSEIIGMYLPVLDAGAFRWERVVDVLDKGMRPVRLLSCDNGVYAAGDMPDRQIFTHNAKT
jgi:hypothetical protein